MQSRVQWTTACFLPIMWLMTGIRLFFCFPITSKMATFPQRFGKAAPGRQIQIQRASSVHEEIVYTQPLSDIPTGRRSWYSTRTSLGNGTLSIEWWRTEQKSVDHASARRIQDPKLSSLKLHPDGWREVRWLTTILKKLSPKNYWM